MITSENVNFKQQISELVNGEQDFLIVKGHCLDALKQIPDGVVQTVVTSSPYFGLRAYGTDVQYWGGDQTCQHEWLTVPPRRSRSESDVKNPTTMQNANKGANCNLLPTRLCSKCDMWEGELGQEPNPERFIKNLVEIFSEVQRVLRDDGVLWVNLADTGWKQDKIKHSILKSKDLCLIPHRFAVAMQEAGWYVRMEVIWAKKNCMPESMNDRVTRSHEQIWAFSKKPHYYYDKYGFTTEPKEAILQKILGDSEHGANLRSVWWMKASDGYVDGTGQHHATFPEELPERCIKLTTSQKGACIECGKPYERDVEKIYPQISENPLNTVVNDTIPDWYGSGGSSFRGHSGYVKADGTSQVPIIITKGWKKACQCLTSQTRPCLVMDIFNGSGTTGIVAIKSGRNYLGLELSSTYAQMAEERLSGKSLPLLSVFDD
jgi:DNA modification methylase